MNKNISPITFIDKLVKKNELGEPFKLMDHQREILRLAFTFDENGRLPWDTIIYSCVKKSGKTTLNGAITLAWGFTQEAPNEILILANDLEQTLARVFKTMEGIIQHNPELQREGRAPIFACTVTSGLRLKKSSLPAKCGTRASIRRIIRRSSAATRSISVSTRASSTTTLRAWLSNGMKTARN